MSTEEKTDNPLKHDLVGIALLVGVFAIVVSLLWLFFARVQGLGGFVSNVAYSQPSDNSLRIIFETKEPSNTEIEYGTSKFYLNSLPVSQTPKIQHSIHLNGLLPDKTHYFRITALAEDGEEHVSQFYSVE